MSRTGIDPGLRPDDRRALVGAALAQTAALSHPPRRYQRRGRPIPTSCRRPTRCDGSRKAAGPRQPGRAAAPRGLQARIMAETPGRKRDRGQVRLQMPRRRTAAHSSSARLILLIDRGMRKGWTLIGGFRRTRGLSLEPGYKPGARRARGRIRPVDRLETIGPPFNSGISSWTSHPFSRSSRTIGSGI